MIIEIARFWASIARPNHCDGRFDIRGVIGPDEYHHRHPASANPGLDNDAYTNVMAAVTLLRAGEIVDTLTPAQLASLVQKLHLSASEVERWRHIALRLRVCFTPEGVISQHEGYDRLKPFDGRRYREQHPNGRIDWELEARGDSADAYQVNKQPAVLMLLYLLRPNELIHLFAAMGYPVDIGTLQRTVRYYLSRMTHESSLSHAVCAGGRLPC